MLSSIDQKDLSDFKPHKKIKETFMEPLVTVVVPVYNVEQYLDECIQSILNQKYQNLEILLIDDGSTDSSYEICKKYSQIDDRIKLIKKENSGLGATRNVGIDNAHGKYIYFLDSDDFIESNLFSIIIPYMEGNSLELCYFSANIVFESNDNHFNPNYYIKQKKYKVDKGTSIFKQLFYNNEYTCSNCLFVTSLDLIKRNHLKVPENMIFEDNFFAFQLSILSYKSGVINKTLYNRRVRDNSIMTKSNKEKRYYGHMRVIEDIYNYHCTDSKLKKIQLIIIKDHLYKLFEFSKDLNKKNETKNFCKKNHYFYSVKIMIKLFLKI